MRGTAVATDIFTYSGEPAEGLGDGELDGENDGLADGLKLGLPLAV